jgi:fatty acyl-CoA reductase
LRTREQSACHFHPSDSSDHSLDHHRHSIEHTHINGLEMTGQISGDQQQPNSASQQQQQDKRQQAACIEETMAGASAQNAGGPPELELTKAQQQPSKRQARKLAQFYEGKNIFITGATGFIGKICLLKLMSSLGNCGTVYIMLRPKKGLTPQQRFNKMLQEAPFKRELMNFDHFPNADEMRAKYGRSAMLTKPIDWSKVVPVDGDMSRENLGLSEQVVGELCDSVHIVFNIAASVQFDAPLKQNLRDNYLGARNLLNLATKFNALQSLVHVSTFYTNSHISHIEEKVLPMNSDCEKMAELISWVPEPLLDQMAPQIMENRPNTYIFTKAMAENLVQKFQGRLPVAIVRPSIVVPSQAEPEPGWVDNVNGPMGLGVLASLGILRNIDWNYWGVCDFVPVDAVVNSMLAVAERTHRLHPNEIKVYNCSTSSLNSTTWGACFSTLRAESYNAPPYKMLRIPIEVPKHKRANKIGFAFTKLSEILFAYFIDLILIICGQKRLLSKLTAKLHHGYEILKPFTTNEYTCSNDNLVAAFDELDEDDKIEFNFNLKQIDWQAGFKHAYYGARKRLLKEDLSNVPASIVKMRILYVAEFLFKALFLAFIAYKLYVNFYVQSDIVGHKMASLAGQSG